MELFVFAKWERWLVGLEWTEPDIRQSTGGWAIVFYFGPLMFKFVHRYLR